MRRGVEQWAVREALEAVERSVGLAPGGGDGMKVLAIDDNADNLVSLEATIRAFLPGSEAATASSGEAGIGMARTFQPDTILLAIQMPGMDGFETCRALKEDPATRHIPVMFLGAQSTDPASRIRGLEIGGDVFLTGPVEPDELMAQVRAMVRVKQAEDVLRGEKVALERIVAERTAALQHEKDLDEAIIQTAQAIVLVLDTQGRIARFNPYMEAISGHKLAEVQGEDWFTTFLPEPDRERTRRLFQDAIGGIQTRGNVNLIVAKDGREHEIEWYDKTLKDAQGNVVGLLSIGQDITERKLAEEEVRASEEKYRELVEDIRDVIFETDALGNLVYLSPATRQVMGYEPENILGRGFLEFVHPEDRDLLIRKFSELAQGIEAPSEYRVLTTTGEARWVRTRTKPVLKGGVFSGARGTLIDITERKRAESETRALLAAIQNERNKLLAVLNGMDDEVWFADTDRTVALANPRALREFAIEPGNTVDIRTLAESLEVLRPDGSPRPVEEAPALRALAGETVHGLEEIVRTPATGELRYREVNAAPVRDPQGNVIGSVSVVRDITEFMRAEKALRQSEEELRWLLKSMLNAFALFESVFDEEGKFTSYRFVYINDAYERITGVRDEEVRGKTVHEVWPETEPGWVKRYGEVAVTGVFQTFDMYHDPTKKLYHCYVYRPWDTKDRFCVIFEDITERKRAEEERAKVEALLQQAQKMEVVGQLAGGVAHEFNNLLQAMLSQAEVLRLEADSAELAEPLAEIEAHIQRGASLTQQLLLFSRRQVTQRKPLDLGELVGAGCVMLRRLLPSNIPVAVEIGPRRVWVEGDASQLQQVLMNLALNARDAMPTGGTLTVRMDGDGGEACLEVADTGHGMAEETRAHLFEPFFTTKQAGHSTGLGLSVVHGIVEQHGGRVEVWSQPGKGSRFRVVLPAAPAQPVPAGSVAQAETKLPRGRGERVLVVEDEDGARTGVTKVLTLVGYQVTAVASGEEALALAETPGFDLLLTDLMLPGIPGAELAERLGERWPALRVVLMSGYTQDITVLRGVEQRAMRFLQKPFGMPALARAVREALGPGRSGEEDGHEG